MKRKESTYQTCWLCGGTLRTERLQTHVSEKCPNRAVSVSFADILTPKSVPDWLLDVAENGMPKVLPISDILRNSCFYPASGFDASPIIIANGFVHSFVFADYGTSKSDYMRAISISGFRGYRCREAREVQKKDIVPDSWMPSIPSRFDESRGLERLMDAQSRCEAFGHWTIWERLEGFDDRHGPSVFSLLFLGGEGIAAYEGLYNRNGIQPAICALIQPGHCFGNNWTNFWKEDAPFWRTVTSRQTSPDYILIGAAGDWSPTEDCVCPFGGYSFLRRAQTFKPVTRNQGVLLDFAGGELDCEVYAYTDLSHTIDLFGANRQIVAPCGAMPLSKQISA